MSRILLFSFLCIALANFPSLHGAPTEIGLSEESARNVITCSICSRFIDAVVQGVQDGATDEGISDAIADICVNSGIYNYRVCYGSAFLAMPTLRYIFADPDFIEGNVCGIFAQSQDCRLSDPASIEWTIPPSSVPKPPVTQPTPPPVGSPTLKVLHLADVHWDPEYQEGSLAVCDDSVCCRNSSGTVVNQADAAGYWGDYRVCDSPWRTVENAVAQIARQHPDIDYIVWTGDLVPHDVWDTSKDENLMINFELLSLMKRYFPSTPLYPTLGNHEAHPVNTFSPPEIQNLGDLSISWLYEDADIQWSRWLPAEVSSTVRYGGYYTTLVRPGLRIVSMNNNYCYTANWWTMLRSQDPASGLLWLSQVLENAERDGEKVHILSHIPPGNPDCWTIFSREFNKLINRFESTVAAQFYGHTHNEEYKVFYDDSGRPVNLAFVGGSLTTYSDLNPGYRIYTVDARPESFTVLDFSTWIMNLTVANEFGANRDPVWFELYQAKKEYGLADLSPASMDDLFNRMLTNDSLFQLYVKNWYKGNYNGDCDSACVEKRLCFIVTTDFGIDCTVTLKRLGLKKEF